MNTVYTIIIALIASLCVGLILSNMGAAVENKKLVRQRNQAEAELDRMTKLKEELEHIGRVLGNRRAFDGCSTRLEKVEKLIKLAVVAAPSGKNAATKWDCMETEMRTWLDKQVVNSYTIGVIRTNLYMPFDCEWNSVVRDETVKREIAEHERALNNIYDKNNL